MNFTQKIKLLSVAANNNSILFKVDVDGEERVFVGKQNTKFDIVIANDIKHTTESEKLSSKIKLLDSIQKYYIVDKPLRNFENKKKDVIIPCAVSTEIVQLGNYMFSMSKETNNKVLYLLYKKRILNRYVDDETKMIFYDIDKSKIDAGASIITPDAILKGIDTTEVKYSGLINDFSKHVIKTNTIKDQNGEILLEEKYDGYDALEKFETYTNMPGKLEELEDFVNVENRVDEMPFNMIYEYGSERQYESDNSVIYTDFIHLKNSLSPFFNVEVTDEYQFKLWRRYVKVDSSNFKLWTSYMLDTPKTVSSEEINKDYYINVGNNNPSEYSAKQKYYFDNMVDFARNSADLKFSDVGSQGFSVHICADRKELFNRFMFGYDRRRFTDQNDNCEYRTQAQFIEWIIEKSNGSVMWKVDDNPQTVYPDDCKFVVNTELTDDGRPAVVFTFVGKQTDSMHSFKIKEDLDYEVPPFVTYFHLNYDEGEYMDSVIGEWLKFTNKNSNIPKISYYDEEPEYIYDWVSINSLDKYRGDGFILEYSEPGISTGLISHEQLHKTVSGSVDSTPIKTDNWTTSKTWFFELFHSEKQFDWIRYVFNNSEKLSSDGKELSLTTTEYEKFFTGGTSPIFPTYDEILTAEIEDERTGYTQLEFSSLTTAQKIKYLLYLLWMNHGEIPTEPNEPPMKNGQYYKGIKNYQLSKADAKTSLNDVIAATVYLASGKNKFNKGDKFKFVNYRLTPYKTTLSENDSDHNITEYDMRLLDDKAVDYFCSPLDIRRGILDMFDGKSIPSDPELNAPNSDASLIDIFGLTIGGKKIPNFKSVSGEIFLAIENSSDEVVTADISVSFTESDLTPRLEVCSYINGQKISTQTYENYTDEYYVLKKNVETLKDLRFWVYGNNIKHEDRTLTVCPFNYRNISVWNYPISLSQSQALKRNSIIPGISKIATNQFTVFDGGYKPLEQSTEEEIAKGVYGRVFSIDTSKTVFDYHFNSPLAEEWDQKLYKISNFEFVDRINGIIKLTPSSGRKSNLYSIRLHNTGLVIEDDDDEATKKFKNSMTVMIRSAVNTICTRVEPVNTKLFKVIIES